MGGASALERQGGGMKEKFFLLIDKLASGWLRWRVERNLKYLEEKVKELHAKRPDIAKVLEAQSKARLN